jgi:hypothetical protein
VLANIQFRIFYLPVCSLNTQIFNLKTLILLAVLYECETWSLTLREEHGLRVFENKVLRRIFGPKMEKVAGDWRRLHNEDLHNLYPSPCITGVAK